MASIPHESPYRERRTQERRRLRYAPPQTDGMRVSWGGVWGGVLVALGLLVLLAALGVAVGISAYDPGRSELENFETGAGIWAAFTLLFALFVGGLVSTRIGAIFDRTTGFFEGALVWVVSMLLVAFLVSSGVGMLAGGAFRLLGGATQAMGVVMEQGGGGQNLSLSTTAGVDHLLLQLGDGKVAQQVASATGMPVEEVQRRLDDIAARVEENRDNPAQAANAAKDGMAQIWERAKSSGALEQKAREVKPEATTAAWISFAALLLSLVAAIAGALAGRRSAVRAGPAMHA